MVLNAITNAKNISGPRHGTTVTKCTIKIQTIINLYSWHIKLWLNLIQLKKRLHACQRGDVGCQYTVSRLVCMLSISVLSPPQKRSCTLQTIPTHNLHSK